MTLHEAMRIVLEERLNKSATTKFLSEEIERRNLYRQKTGGIAHPAQIFLRARKYPHLFDLIDRDIVRLKTSAINNLGIAEPKLEYDDQELRTTNGNIESVINHLNRNAKPFSKIEYFAKQPGIYAIFFYGDKFPLEEAVEYLKIRPIIYIGKTESSSYERDFKQHFTSGQTGRSTLRRSFGALLKEQLNLKPIPRNISENSDRRYRNYKFDSEGEIRLTDWMKSNLGLSFYPMERDIEQIKTLEKELINKLVPVLNLKDNYGNIFYSLVEKARNICVQLAKDKL